VPKSADFKTQYPFSPQLILFRGSGFEKSWRFVAIVFGLFSAGVFSSVSHLWIQQTFVASSLPMLALFAIASSFGSCFGAALFLGFALSESFFRIPWMITGRVEALQLCGLAVFYLFYGLLLTSIPKATNAMRAQLIRVESHLAGYPTAFAGALLQAAITYFLVYAWMISAPLVLRPVYLWIGRSAQVAEISPFQHYAWLLAGAAAFAAFVRIFVEFKVLKSPNVRQMYELGLAQMSGESEAISLPSKLTKTLKPIFQAFVITLFSAGFLTTWADGAVYFCGLLVLISMHSKFLSGSKLQHKFIENIPAAFRLALASVINYFFAVALMERLWTSSSFIAVLIIALFGFAVCRVLLVRAPAAKSALLFLFIMHRNAFADNCSGLSDCFGNARAAALVAAMLPIVVSVLIDFSPLGNIKGVIGSVTGKDIITGEKLSMLDRVLGVLPFVGGLRKLARLEKMAATAYSVEVKTEAGAKAYAKIQHAVETLPDAIKVQRIREGSEVGKVAIVGRSMGNAEQGLVGVRDAAAHMKSHGHVPETFEPSKKAWDQFLDRVEKYRTSIGSETAYLPDNLVKNTVMYKENLSWVTKLREKGYTVLDIGNPNGLNDPSVFYEMEKGLLFP
jgi:hypothetical protein